MYSQNYRSWPGDRDPDPIMWTGMRRSEHVRLVDEAGRRARIAEYRSRSSTTSMYWRSLRGRWPSTVTLLEAS